MLDDITRVIRGRLSPFYIDQQPLSEDTGKTTPRYLIVCLIDNQNKPNDRTVYKTRYHNIDRHN